MKGLIMQDLVILKNQKILWILVAVLSFFYITMGMATFMISFGSVFWAMVTVKTVYLELEKNVAPFLFTLPFSKTQYVGEKYLISFLLPVVYMVVFGLICLIFKQISLEEIGISFIASLLVVGLMIALFIPLSIRFKDKATLVSIGMTGIFLLIISWVGENGHFDNLDFLSPYWPTLQMVFPIVWVLILGGSIWLSLKWIQKEEF